MLQFKAILTAHLFACRHCRRLRCRCLRVMERIVYLHGFASGPASRKAQYFAGRLRDEGFRVDVPALDGGDFQNLTISGQLAIVGEATNGQAVDLIGSSLGGYVAALYAARNSNIRRLVLLAPAFDFHRLWENELGAERERAWRENGSLQVFHYAQGREAAVGFALMEDAARYEPFPDCHQPTLIFHGELDPTVPPAISEQYVREHGDAELVLVPSGHELTDVLDVIWPKMLDFLLHPCSKNQC